MVRILIVEDDEMVAAWTRRTLVEAGYQVDIAITGEEGRQLGLAGSYDLFIIDLELPRRSGLTTASQSVSRRPRNPTLSRRTRRMFGREHWR